ncbi:MAG: ComF family protein [Defluviitaleaceae bacterium]|nr:ComF family protein [Defluviitaleaceae bacterium]
MNEQFKIIKNPMDIALEKVYDTIFPNKCLFCKKVLGTITEITCTDCKRHWQANLALGHNIPEGLSAVYAPCDYSEAVRRVIIRFKYEEGKRALARPIAKMIARCMSKIDCDFLLPVPLHKKRIKERGFNQARQLATELGRAMNIPAYDGLVRTKDTVRQYELDQKERESNMQDAFALKPDFCVKDARVLLVDDILTTGATARECAKILTNAGASSVELVVFAVAI